MRPGLSILDHAAYWSGVTTRYRRRVSHGITILMYHKVLPVNRAALYPLSNLVITAETFEKHARWLASHCRVMTVREAIANEGREAKVEKPVVCISFDDGYRDNAECAAPILERHGLRATFFVTTDFVAGRPLWFDRAAWAWRKLGPRQLADRMGSDGPVTDVNRWLGGLKHRPPAERGRLVDAVSDGITDDMPEDVFGAMSIQQLRTLHETGHEIASHTKTHPILPTLDDATLDDELRTSRQHLAEWLGQEPKGFSYPNGNHDGRIVEAVTEAGYRYACTVQRGHNPPNGDHLRLKRRMISQGSSPSTAGFAAETFGLHDALRRRR